LVDYLQMKNIDTDASDETDSIQTEPLIAAESWIFQANPIYYNVTDAVQKLRTFTWSVSRYADRIRPGHRVYLWRPGKDPAIVAIASVLTEVALLPADDDVLRFAVQPEALEGTRPRVRLKIDAVVRPALSKHELRADSRLSELSILRYSQAANFPVTKE